MKNKSAYLRPILPILCIFIFNGCANYTPVRTFADETKKLSVAFEPMLSGSASSCYEKYMWKKLTTSSKFDPETAEKNAKELCGSIDEDNKIIADLNSLLEQYAETLSALADDKLPTYKTELDGLKDSLGKLKKPGSQDALLNADKVAAVNSLTEFLGRVVTQRFQRKAIRELIDHEEAIKTVTDALKDYATLNYRSWLNDQLREIKLLQKSLDESSKNEPLASNYLKSLLLLEEKKIEARSKAIDSFVKSITELQATNSELKNKFDHLDDKELISQIFNFSKEVSSLRKKINDAF